VSTFTSAVLELGPSGGCFTNHHALAWVLDQVRRRAPAVSEGLHRSSRAKPFTVWAGSYDELGGAFLPTVSGAELLLRVTALSEPVSGVLRRIVMNSPGRAALGSASFPVIACATSSSAHPLAGESTPEAILGSVTAERFLPDRVTLHFLSPTAFTGSVGNTLFPLPDLVFRSILRKWNAYAAVPIGDTIAEDLLARLQVESHHLATRPPVRLAGGSEKGFVGWCEYSVGHSASADVRTAMHVLARAAFYTGVGARTTMGMGQAVTESRATR
jgi:CRISPR-associated endoribonuclease Cas6